MLERLRCRMVFYSDHSNFIINQGVDLCDVEKNYFSHYEELVSVPLAIKAPEMKVGIDESFTSIMNLNEIIIKLLNKEQFTLKKDYIKVLRSEIYNLSLKFLYVKVNKQRELLAFKAFAFEDDYRLVVYLNGEVELYTKQDKEINDIL